MKRNEKFSLSLFFFFFLFLLTRARIFWLWIFRKRIYRFNSFGRTPGDPSIRRKVNRSLFDIVKDQGGSLQEGMLDVLSCFGTGFNKDEAVLLGETAGFFKGDFSLVFKILLVAYQHDDGVWVGEVAGITQPAGQVIECGAPSNVINEQGSSSPAVIATG